MNEWFYDDNGSQVGPVSKESLLKKFELGELKPSTRIWKVGMRDWEAADSVEDFIRDHAQLSGTDHELPTSTSDTLISGEEASPYSIPQTNVEDMLLWSGNHRVMPPSYLAHSVVLFLIIFGFTFFIRLGCCCFFFTCPLVVIPLIYSALVSNRYGRGDYAGAEAASATAKFWCIFLWIIVVLTFVLFLVLLVRLYGGI